MLSIPLSAAPAAAAAPAPGPSSTAPQTSGSPIPLPPAAAGGRRPASRQRPARLRRRGCQGPHRRHRRRPSQAPASGGSRRRRRPTSWAPPPPRAVRSQALAWARSQPNAARARPRGAVPLPTKTMLLTRMQPLAAARAPTAAHHGAFVRRRSSSAAAAASGPPLRRLAAAAANGAPASVNLPVATFKVRLINCSAPFFAIAITKSCSLCRSPASPRRAHAHACWGGCFTPSLRSLTSAVFSRCSR